MRYARPSELTPVSRQDAIDALNTLQSPYAVIAARNKAWREGREIPGEETLPEMRVYLKRLGYTV